VGEAGAVDVEVLAGVIAVKLYHVQGHQDSMKIICMVA
jgi:hypothetical protein